MWITRYQSRIPLADLDLVDYPYVMGRQLDSDAIEKRLGEIRETIVALQSEAEELQVALRVIERFSEPMPVLAKGHLGFSKMGPVRPAGIPSNFDIVETILKSAERGGRYGLTTNEIVDEIRERYWPGLVASQIVSYIYKFAKEGRIRKSNDGKFSSLSPDNKGSEAKASDPDRVQTMPRTSFG